MHGVKFRTTCSGRSQSDRIAAIRKHMSTNPEMREAHRKAWNKAQTGSPEGYGDGDNGTERGGNSGSNYDHARG